MLTVSGVCNCHRCVERTTDIYRMVGYCRNCGTTGILMLFRSGDEARALDCPVCGVWHVVLAQRLATPDEIPASEPNPA